MKPHADSALPNDPAAVVAVIAALHGELAEERAARRAAELGLEAKTLEAERLRVQIARLRHERFGRSSERLAGEVEQLELRLDEVLADIAASGGAGEDESASAKAPEEKAQRCGRNPLPDGLPRWDVEHLPAEGCACRSCGGALRKVGEDITEILEYRPGRFEVVRHIRPAFSRRTCEAMTHASTLLCLGQGRAAGLSGPHRGVSGRGALAPLGDGLGVQPAAGGQGAGALFRRLELGSNTRRRAG